MGGTELPLLTAALDLAPAPLGSRWMVANSIQHRSETMVEAIVPSWDPIWPLFLGHTPLTEKNGHTDVYGFCSTACQTNTGFIPVIYANDRKKKNMAIRANTAKYGSLTETKTAIRGARSVLWMDAIHFAPPKKPWNDDSPVNTNKQWFSMVAKWCEMDFVHPQYFQGNHQIFVQDMPFCGPPVVAFSLGPRKQFVFLQEGKE